MPAAYVKMRDKFAADMPLDEAKTKAARIYNSQNPDAPVTGNYDKKHPPKSKGKRKTKPQIMRYARKGK